MAINQATINDLDELVYLFDQYRIFYIQASDLAGARQFLFDKFEHRESVLFIAREMANNQIIGFTQLYPTFSSISMKRAWILNDLFVLEDYRNRTVAKLLLEHAKEYAIQTHAKGIELSTAYDNVRAQGLYEKLGYKKDEEYYHYYLTL
ncbi:GNAT family N-acetyltransferase [Cohnella luojiensis]|uniref:GNAT family N-acetyltransferase n=1 Tax=Cohnella luojiensis TaxID=652876 RepID=A0A4Y8LU37_9BACL|nr:GNAT family N-acetyltransferase [Cohnella luojiensis]